jgi:AmmeMemoRadiSam system protein B/AmmeMemoRadiSam system protein A
MVSSCYGQKNKQAENKIDRKPAVAGSFYSENKARLEYSVSNYFKRSDKVLSKSPLAVIVPHAGYVFSGEVAAASYKQLDRDSKFDHVFIIGSSHTAYFEGASIYTVGDFLTPLGKVPVDPLASSLVQQYGFINADPRMHSREHSLEVQLPFLQFWLRHPFTIVPIIIGGDNRETCKRLAGALKPYFTEKNLFVISTDFSHYPDYSNAVKSDKFMADAIVTNSPDKFLKAKLQMEGKNIPNLATAICGWTSVLTLLNITENKSDLVYKKILYKNSGDSEYGEKDRVVGYYALCVTTDGTASTNHYFDLSREDKIQLLTIARKTIDTYITKNTYPNIRESKITKNNRGKMGAFVTLYYKDDLRGCIGNIESEIPLYKSIQSLVVSSAIRDYRFKPVDTTELKDIEIEISVLTPMQKIDSIDEIEMGRHGIYIRKEFQTGTFLPQVARETNWSKEEFLGRCARDKAHIGWEGWRDAELYVYEALKFCEEDYRDELK